jgi:hypothetical protein
MAQHACMYMSLAIKHYRSTLRLSPSSMQSYQGGEYNAHGTFCWPMLLGHWTNLDDRQK